MISYVLNSIIKSIFWQILNPIFYNVIRIFWLFCRKFQPHFWIRNCINWTRPNWFHFCLWFSRGLNCRRNNTGMILLLRLRYKYKECIINWTQLSFIKCKFNDPLFGNDKFAPKFWCSTDIHTYKTILSVVYLLEFYFIIRMYSKNEIKIGAIFWSITWNRKFKYVIFLCDKWFKLPIFFNYR